MSLSSAVVPAAIRFDQPILEAQQGHPTRIAIVAAVKPALTALAPVAATPLAVGKDPASQEALDRLRAAFDAVKRKYHSVCGERLQKYTAAAFQLTPEAIAACEATAKILHELYDDLYTEESARDMVECSLALLANHLEGGAPTQKVEDLTHRVLQGEGLTVIQRSGDDVNNPAYTIQDANKQPLAYLKQAKSDREASHRFVIQDMPLYHAKTRELIGYEADQLLGLHRVPTTYKVVCNNVLDGAATVKEATIQTIVPDGKPFGSHGIFTAGGAKALKTLDIGNVHMTAISGLIKGLAAGHMDNYVVAGKKLFEIDLKECLIPFNTMPANMKVKRADGCDDLEKLLQEAPDEATRARMTARLETERKSIQLGRMIILGLPRCGQPFEKATLLFLTHPSHQILMQAHHASIVKQGYDIQPSALTAQLERLTQLQELARAELAKPEIEATPRDFYFALFGGKELFEYATQVKQYHPILVFNGIVGNSYRHYFKDLSQPESLPVRPRELPAGASETQRTIFENLQALV